MKSIFAFVRREDEKEEAAGLSSSQLLSHGPARIPIPATMNHHKGTTRTNALWALPV
jgi:hypothetical protein